MGVTVIQESKLSFYKSRAEETLNSKDLLIRADARIILELLREIERLRTELTFSEYQAGATKTAIYPGQGEILGLLYVALGLGEAGELQGKIKKVLRDSDGVVTSEARDKISAELGDLFWYAAAICTEIGISMNDVGQKNLAKLASRKERGVLQGDGDNR